MSDYANWWWQKLLVLDILMRFIIVVGLSTGSEAQTLILSFKLIDRIFTNSSTQGSSKVIDRERLVQMVLARPSSFLLKVNIRSLLLILEKST